MQESWQTVSTVYPSPSLTFGQCFVIKTSPMSTHSYSRCWIHLVWTTLDREPMLTKPAAAKASGFLTEYAVKNGVYMKINYCNAEHVHTLIDLPTNKCIEEVVKLFKGSSSHGSMKTDSCAGDFHGVEVMERSRYLIRTASGWQGISLDRNSIIERSRSKTSFSCSCKSMDSSGVTTETVENGSRSIGET